MKPESTAPVDGRRRTWIKSDVFFYSGALGKGLREKFGIEGVVCFDAFLRACKVSQIEGQVRYANDDQFLSLVGLDAISWTNDAGKKWTLDELWRWLGNRHMTARRRQNGLTVIESRRWDEWQARRPDPRNTTKKRPRYDSDAALESEREMESERETTPPVAPPSSNGSRLSLVEPYCGRPLEEIMTADPDTLTAEEIKRQLAGV